MWRDLARVACHPGWVVARRYRVKYVFHDADGGYQTRTTELASLRAAGEFVRDLPSPSDFVEIKAVS